MTQKQLTNMAFNDATDWLFTNKKVLKVVKGNSQSITLFQWNGGKWKYASIEQDNNETVSIGFSTKLPVWATI